MNPDLKWSVVRVDGKIAAVSTDLKQLVRVSSYLVQNPPADCQKITWEVVPFEEIWELKKTVAWEDLYLTGSEFKKNVWKHLFDLTHSGKSPELVSYSAFARKCGNRKGVRAVAHAVGLNPIAVIIPCHLVIPKESIDRINGIYEQAETTLFKEEGLFLFDTIDFGLYELGKDVKKELIKLELMGH